MPVANARSGPGDGPRSPVDEDVDVEPVMDGDADPVAMAGNGDASPAGPLADAVAAAKLRWRLAVVAGFLAVFHLAFAAIKVTGPAAGPGSTSDAPAWSLLVRAAVAGLVFALLRSPLRLGLRHLRVVEAGLFGFEMLVILAAQYLSAVDLIDRRDLVDAVAVQKNGVIRTLFLMICCGVFVPRAPAATARIVVTMAAALILCHGLVLHHADTAGLDMDDVASHQIVMTNALFLIMGVALASIAAWVLRGRDGAQEEPGRVGPYRLLRKLDEGGAAEVYLAEHAALRRPCALKLVRAGDLDATARFSREVAAAAKLSHPNTVAIFDAGRTDDGTPYCAMEYLPGLCVADIVERSGPMPASRAVHLGRQVCGALAEAHRVGLIHRDVTPANVFVSVLGGRCDVAKLLDFGAVGASDSTAGGSIVGTPEYVAPEQAVAGSRVDGRADVYAVGALLYFMVTGRPPFERDTPGDVLRAHVSEPVTPPHERAAGVPPDLEAVILRCLAKRPHDRYPDARAVAAALAACGCATEWDESRAEGWWLEQASGTSAASREPPASPA